MQYITPVKKDSDDNLNLYYLDLEKVQYLKVSANYLTFFFQDRAETFKVSEEALLQLTRLVATHVIYSGV